LTVTAADRRAQMQRMESPYLLTAVTNRLGIGVAVTGDAGIAVAEVAAHGQWSPHLGEQVSVAVRMCLAGPSASIIVDLRDLRDLYGVSLSFWLAVWRQARFGTVPVDVTFCLPLTTALSRRLRYLAGPQPRVFATVPDARMAIARRIPRADRLQARFEPRPASVKAARALATQACHAWHLQELLPDTWLIVSELAANAVEHAATDFVVTVSRSGTRLHVAIHDCVSRFPRMSTPELISPQASLDERGRGLRLVHSVAAAWGAMPTRDGKVVWATVR
jgi:anti-sigma regulatory factor (Ser/Thr protein kinase)